MRLHRLPLPARDPWRVLFGFSRVGVRPVGAVGAPPRPWVPATFVRRERGAVMHHLDIAVLGVAVSLMGTREQRS